MNKREFIKTVASKSTFSATEAQVEEILDIASNTFFQDLKKTGKSKFWNLFIAEIKERVERPGVNPKNGRPIIIAAKQIIKTKATTALSRVADED